MPKVLCTLPNASDEISGVKFTTHAKGMVSEDVSDDVASTFASIPGYEVVGAAPAGGDGAAEKAAAEKAAAEAAAAAEAEKSALLARAAAIEFKVKQNWSLERLKSEVETAEKAAAEAAAAEKAAAEAK